LNSATLQKDLLACDARRVLLTAQHHRKQSVLSAFTPWPKSSLANNKASAFFLYTMQVFPLSYQTEMLFNTTHFSLPR
jgi:hypothetical protein